MAIRSDEITSIIRNEIKGFDAGADVSGVGTIVEVGDYFDLPADLLATADVLVNFVGLSKHPDRRVLWRVNAVGPVALALAAWVPPPASLQRRGDQG